MSTPNTKQAGSYLLATTLAPLVALTTIALVSKDPSFAADQRLILALIALTTATLGVVGFLLALRHYKTARLMGHYEGATRAINDTVRYILHEGRLATGGRLELIFVLLASAALFILSAWPQLSVLSAMRHWFMAIAMCSGMLLMLQPLAMRAHIVNGVYLRRYLRQQVAHIGFIPGRTARDERERAAARAKLPEDSYCAGGFVWRFDDAAKNILCLGQPGSGKTITVLNAHLERLLAVRQNGLATAAIIFDPKSAYADTIGPLCQRLGREPDLFVLSPDTWAEAARTPGSIAWNPIDTKDDLLEVASRIAITARLVGGVKTNDSFFADAGRLFMRHAPALYRAAFAPEPPSLLDIHRLCSEPTGEGSEYERLMLILDRKYPTAFPPDVQNALAYFENEWLCLPEKQRAGVRSTVTQLLDDFTTDPIAEIFSGPSTISIADAIDQGKIIYVHMPLAGRERLSRIVTNLMKLEFQREILRRVRKPRPSFMMADEFQTLFVAGEERGDSDFFERSRESNHGNLVAIQNLSSLYKKTPNTHEVTNFLGLCATKILLRNSERETNEWASQLFGEQSEIIVSMSETARMWWFGFSRNQANYSRSTRSTRVVPPDAFTTLAIPIKENLSRHCAESVVHLGSREMPEKLDLIWPVRDLAS